MLAVDVEKNLGEFSISARFVSDGGATALFGPSGAGKTSIINLIAGLMTPDRGHVALDDVVLFDSVAGIERGQRLVEQQQARPHQQRTANGDALAFAAR